MGTRERILQAAREVVAAKGSARATTREIARAAGLSEGALYKHFESKEELLHNLLQESPTNFPAMVAALPAQAGHGSVLDNLRRVGLAAVDFYGESLPLGALLLSDPKLLERQRSFYKNREGGPQKAIVALARYIAAEQDHGRVAAELNPQSAASLFLGACFQKAYLMKFLNQRANPGEIEAFVAGLLTTLEPTLGSGSSPKGRTRR